MHNVNHDTYNINNNNNNSTNTNNNNIDDNTTNTNMCMYTCIDNNNNNNDNKQTLGDITSLTLPANTASLFSVASRLAITCYIDCPFR